MKELQYIIIKKNNPAKGSRLSIIHPLREPSVWCKEGRDEIKGYRPGGAGTKFSTVGPDGARPLNTRRHKANRNVRAVLYNGF